MAYYQQPQYAPIMNQAMNPIIAQQQQRLAQMEQMYPQFQQPMMQPQQQMPVQGMPQRMINGRMISDTKEIIPNEIPMDGSVTLFMLDDKSKIFSKRWNENGVVENEVYERVLAEDSMNTTNCEEKTNYGAFDKLTSMILARIDELEKKIDSMGVVKPTRATKKESE